MLNIGISANPENRQRLKLLISQCLREINIDASISYVTGKPYISKILDFDSKYNILIISDENELMYLKKTSVNFGKKRMNLIYGYLREPFDPEQLEEIILSPEDFSCPQKIYKINNNKSFRLVFHGEIEYFHWNGEKTVMHLAEGETEEISTSVKKIKESLPEDYFIECKRGCYVNLFNIKKFDLATNEIIFKSGSRVSISRKNFNRTILSFLESMYGLLTILNGDTFHTS